MEAIQTEVPPAIQMEELKQRRDQDYRYLNSGRFGSGGNAEDGYSYGGVGGGGYYGGGAGWIGEGGGGGSSYCDGTVCTLPVYSIATGPGNGMATITYSASTSIAAPPTAAPSKSPTCYPTAIASTTSQQYYKLFYQPWSPYSHRQKTPTRIPTTTIPFHISTTRISTTIPPTAIPSMTNSWGLTGASDSWIFPSGVKTIHVTLLGASVGSSTDDDAGCRYDGGYGANVSATLSVTPGSTLKITVGGQGFHCESLLKRCGGFNRGGYGRPSSSCDCGGGGRTEIGQDG